MGCGLVIYVSGEQERFLTEKAVERAEIDLRITWTMPLRNPGQLAKVASPLVHARDRLIPVIRDRYARQQIAGLV